MNKISRRQFIKLSSFSIAATSFTGLMGCAMKPERDISLGVQLYSVREELAKDFEGTISKIAAMGFDGVEFADYFEMSAEEIKAILDKYDLRCCGSHVLLDVLLGDSFDQTVAFNKTLGNENFIIRYIPEEDRKDRQTFLQTIETYNEVAGRLEHHGMRLGYHNHDYIFEKFGDDYLWDILADKTDDRFIMQLDTGHAAGMNQDPVELIKRHPGRSVSLHAKAYSSANEKAVIGEDELDWRGIKEASKEFGGIEWFVLEYEIEGVPPLEALSASINNFQQV